VIDAAGAIYVIGGWDGSKYFNDILMSADGGADRTGDPTGYSGALGDFGMLTPKVV
jgi:hypothetical protein